MRTGFRKNFQWSLAVTQYGYDCDDGHSGCVSMSGAVVMRIPKPLSLKPETQNPKPETLNPALQKVPSGLGVSSPPGSRSAGGSGLFALRSWGVRV